MNQTEFDAIVVGTGISGGWAAKELCEKGLKTLVLERGRMVSHPEDYKTANMDPWDFPFGGQPTQEDIKRQEEHKRKWEESLQSDNDMFALNNLSDEELDDYFNQ